MNEFGEPVVGPIEDEADPLVAGVITVWAAAGAVQIVAVGIDGIGVVNYVLAANVGAAVAAYMVLWSEIAVYD